MSNPAVAPTEPVQPQQHLGTLPVASIPMCPQLANPNSTVVNTQTPAYSQQQFMPALQHQQPEVMFGNHMSAAAQSQQPAPPQMVFAGYNMVAVPPAATGTSAIAAATAGYEQRHTVSYIYALYVCWIIPKFRNGKLQFREEEESQCM